MKDEQELCSHIIAALRKITPFAFKIPDTIGQRFTPPKPFDIFTVIEGAPIAVEVKIIGRSENLRFKMLRDSQIIGLTDWQNSGGISLVAVGFPWARGDWRVVFIPYSTMVMVKTMTRDKLAYDRLCFKFENQKFNFLPLVEKLRYYF